MEHEHPESKISAVRAIIANDIKKDNIIKAVVKKTNKGFQLIRVAE